MAYTSWSVVFGEQPSAAKWNILGTNDASFNDGTGIANFSTSTTAISNPYKFSAYRNAAQNTGNTGFAIVNFDTELFDTNNDFDVTTNVGRYTAPVNGFYFFSANVSSIGVSDFLATLYKNGTILRYGSRIPTGTVGNTNCTVTSLLQLTAGDYIEVYTYNGGAARALEVGLPVRTFFEGYLMSRT